MCSSQTSGSASYTDNQLVPSILKEKNGHFTRILCVESASVLRNVF